MTELERGQILLVNEKEVRELITSPEILDLVEEALKYFAQGKTVNPTKLSLQIAPYHEGHINSMPSYIEPGDMCGVKVVSVHQNNTRNYGLPTTIGTIILHDPETGMPYCLMGGTAITDLRTGAVSGIFAKYLARENSEVLTVVGAGSTGFASMEMTMLALSKIKEVRVYDLSMERVNEFIDRAKKVFPDKQYVACSSNEEALRGADVVMYATSASAPILEGSKIDDGTTVVCVSEKLTPKAIAMFDGWYVDFTECAIERYNSDGRHAAELSGRPYEDLTEEMVTGEIGDIIAGKIKGRINESQKLLAASVGMSIEDVICARAVFDAAMKKGYGKVLDFQN